jgi:DNA-binding YbaB/EbfC family protein
MNQQQQMMRQLQKMQADMQKAQQELAEAEVTGTAGGGMVTVTASGSGDVKAVKIDPKAVDPDDVELLEDMVVAAVADARRAADAMQQSKLGGLTSGLNLPGF